jgi:hypothetical protein
MHGRGDGKTPPSPSTCPPAIVATATGRSRILREAMRVGPAAVMLYQLILEHRVLTLSRDSEPAWPPRAWPSASRPQGLSRQPFGAFMSASPSCSTSSFWLMATAPPADASELSAPPNSSSWTTGAWSRSTLGPATTCSKSSKTATAGAPPSSPASYPSPNGTRSSARPPTRRHPRPSHPQRPPTRPQRRVSAPIRAATPGLTHDPDQTLYQLTKRRPPRWAVSSWNGGRDHLEMRERHRRNLQETVE